MRKLYLIEASAAKENDPNHHLSTNEFGWWRMRVTVDRGPKYTGERVMICLGTNSETEARIRRDLVIAALCKAALIAGPEFVIHAGTTADD
jgi:hypothetical protein